MQEQICSDHSVEVCEAFDGDKVGVSRTAVEGKLPLNGLRHPPTSGTTGWYLWGGEEFSDARDFFQPVHLAHLGGSFEIGFKFLLLPPGWRFLTDGTYEDIWFDKGLVAIE